MGYSGTREEQLAKARAYQRKRYENPVFRERHAKYNKDWRLKVKDSPEFRNKRVLNQIRYRSRKEGLICSITAADIVCPDRCPGYGENGYCGTPLVYREGHFEKDGPSVDRLIPALGYVPGNVLVICIGCNRAKQNLTADQHRGVADWIDRMTQTPQPTPATSTSTNPDVELSWYGDLDLSPEND